MNQTAENTFDYIVLGAGSAGCVVAKRLGENTAAKVLLVEAGGKGDQLFIRMPAGNGFLFGNPRFDWGYQTTPQKELFDRKVYYPRGRGLGGSSILNGMIYTRGDPRDFDGWGISGWRYEDLLPYFKKSEKSLHQDAQYHGTSGPLKITRASDLGVLDRAFIEAATQSGHAYNPDFNDGHQHGIGIIDVTVHRGQRQSSALAYLKGPGKNKNLTVLLNSIVASVNFNGRKAVSINYTQSQDINTAFCSGEIIVSLGTFASPQLLMLSGIGCAKDLEKNSIKVVADLPGVGKNLQDHANYPLTYNCQDSSLTYARLQRFDRALCIGIQYLLTKSGPCANPFWKTNLFQTIDGRDAPADLQTYLTPMIVDETPEKEARFFGLKNLGSKILVRGKKAGNGFQLDINQMHPQSRGQVSLNSTNPLHKPRINPNFLSEEKDRQDFIAGIKIIRDVISQDAFDGLRGDEISPGSHVTNDKSLLNSIRRHLTTGHHPVGTCKMGFESDTSAVVDNQLRVIGIENLRVADGSIMPSIITGNTNAPIIAFAEKAAVMILDNSKPA